MIAAHQLRSLVERAFQVAHHATLLRKPLPVPIESPYREFAEVARDDWESISHAASKETISSGELIARIRQLSTDLKRIGSDADLFTQESLGESLGKQIEELASSRQELEDLLGVKMIGPEDPAYALLDSYMVHDPLAAESVRSEAQRVLPVDSEGASTGYEAQDPAPIETGKSLSDDSGMATIPSGLFDLVLTEQRDSALAAASRRDYEPLVAELPTGERLVAQRMSDWQAFLSLRFPRERAKADQIIRAVVGMGPTESVVLLILVDDGDAWTSEYVLDTDRLTVPRIALTTHSALDINDLSMDESAALTQSIAGASGRCKDAWLRVVQTLSSSHPFHVAIRQAFE